MERQQESPAMRLAAVRKALGLSQDGLARELDVSSKAVQSWETERRSMGVVYQRLGPKLSETWGPERGGEAMLYLTMGADRPPWLDEKIHARNGNG